MLRIENSATRCFEPAVCREAGGPISRQAVRLTTMFTSEGKSRSVNSGGLGGSPRVGTAPKLISISDGNASSGSGRRSDTLVFDASEESMTP